MNNIKYIKNKSTYKGIQVKRLYYYNYNLYYFYVRQKAIQFLLIYLLLYLILIFCQFYINVYQSDIIYIYIYIYTHTQIHTLFFLGKQPTFNC